MVTSRNTENLNSLCRGKPHKKVKGSVFIMAIIRIEKMNIDKMTIAEIREMHKKFSDLYDTFVQKYCSYNNFINGKTPTNKQQKHLDYLKNQAIKWEKAQLSRQL